MSSLKQIEASRRNAERSTGPRTEEGKAVSRYNSLRSGIEAATGVVLPTESFHDLSMLTTEYLERLHRRINETHRTYAKTLELLNKLQECRRGSSARTPAVLPNSSRKSHFRPQLASFRQSRKPSRKPRFPRRLGASAVKS